MKPTDRGHGAGHHSDPDELHNDDVAHEETDIDIQRILVFAGALAGVVVVVAVLMYALMMFFERQAQQNDPQLSPLSARAPALPPTTTASPYFGNARAPQLLTNEYALLDQVHARERDQLSGYGWVDQAAGVVRMPIDEAKKKIVERGLPARADAPVDPRKGTTLPARGEANGGRTLTAAPAADAPAPAQAPANPPAAHTGH
jgi:hypothetical protein